MNDTAEKPSQILPGLKPVTELLGINPHKISEILCRKNFRELPKIEELAHKHGIPVRIVESKILDKICMDANHQVSHQGLIARISNSTCLDLPQMLEQINQAPLPLLLALDQIQDPGNLGAIARTAWALGTAGIILPAHSSARPGAAAMKSSAGALERLPICIVPNLARALDTAEEFGLNIFGAVSSSPTAHNPSQNALEFSWPLPAILVLGSEARGIRPGVLKRCGQLLHIPLVRQFDSLNIAQAGAILLGLCAKTNPTA